MDRQPVVVNFGGGVNSTALLGGLVERQERVDMVIFADTGGERPETYKHIEAVSSWLQTKAYPPIEITRWVRKTGEFISLEEACLTRKELPSLAYGFKGCSTKWKAQPVDKAVKARFADHLEVGGKVVRCLGFDADETRRAKVRESDEWDFRYPLIEWDWGREECIQAIQRLGLPIAAKSSCFFCPAMKKAEIRDLAVTHPELLTRALAIESNAVTRSIKGLGRNWAWRDVIAQEQEVAHDFPPVIACDCYDGGPAEDGSFPV